MDDRDDLFVSIVRTHSGGWFTQADVVRLVWDGEVTGDQFLSFVNMLLSAKAELESRWDMQ